MKRNHVILIVFVSVFSLVSLTLFIGIPFFTFASLEESVVEEDVDSLEYQYLQLNPTTNEISYGFVSIFEELEGYDSVDYTDEDGNLVLISNAGVGEYVCRGTCECLDEDNERRTTAIAASRGIVFLVAAASLLFANEKAKEYMEEKCPEELHHCSNLLGHQLVDICESVVDAQKGKSQSSSKKYADGVLNYSCEGKCLVSKDIKEDYKMKFSKEFKCNKISTGGEILHESAGSEEETLRLVKEKFQNFYLIPYCDSLGVHQEVATNEAGEKYRKERVRVCVGSHGYEINSSIRCRRAFEHLIK